MMIKKKIRPIITIDGPAASGKGTISKKVAKKLNLFYLETGIFYRIIGKEFAEGSPPSKGCDSSFLVVSSSFCR